MRSTFYRRLRGCFLHAYSYNLLTQKMRIQHTYCSGVRYHILFSKEKHLLCLTMTLHLSQPTSQPSQHRPKHGIAENKEILHSTACHSWGWRGKYSSWALSQTHWPGTSIGSSTDWCWSAHCKVLFLRDVSTLSRAGFWLYTNGRLQGASCCKTSTVWHELAKDPAVAMLPC